MRVDQEWLQDIFEAIEKVEKYAARGKEAFKQEELIQVWVIHHLQIIGEAAGRISDEIQERYPEIPWPQIISLRNIIVHDYFGIDAEEIWSTVKNDLPKFKSQIIQILQNIEGSGEQQS